VLHTQLLATKERIVLVPRLVVGVSFLKYFGEIVVKLEEWSI
tara:strand:+ start:98 stop:223 length:126 start_codon:yes stop_codon:yes gene_type:complete